MTPTTVITKMLAILERAYGPTRPPRTRRHPLDELTLAILSQDASDADSRRAFQVLRQVMPMWTGGHRAPVTAVAEAIGAGGHASGKAARSKTSLDRIAREHGHVDLSRFRDRSGDEATAHLSRCKGIGALSIACVPLDALGKPALPVDTHVCRVIKRLEAITPPALSYPLSMNLLEHGRTICNALAPPCHACPLHGRCRYVR